MNGDESQQQASGANGAGAGNGNAGNNANQDAERRTAPGVNEVLGKRDRVKMFLSDCVGSLVTLGQRVQGRLAIQRPRPVDAPAPVEEGASPPAAQGSGGGAAVPMLV